MKLIVLSLFLLFLTLPGQTGKYTEIGGLPPVPSYAVSAIREKIVVDGQLSEKAWAKAAPITLMFPWEEQMGVKQRTTVRLMRDQNYLYVGYECEDADITALHENRDDPVYQDDCVEIFLKPSDKTDHYFGLEMNARGVLFDYYYAFPEKNDRGFNLEGVLLKTSLNGLLNQDEANDQGWTLELAIPWKSLNKLAGRLPPAKGDEWRAQINRWDGTEAKGRRLSMWCASGLKKPGPHNPERFGKLIFK
ncbi:MAG: carbohydrate-binding family 9-like protein [Acidobacteria bacterium]|nr:carbohydrate-binding family 9-like protein [Acidobacteriota bacterium]